MCRLFGFADPRSEGSHNPGATNVLRVGNTFAAALTLVGDVAKGVVPVTAVGNSYLSPAPTTSGAPTVEAVCSPPLGLLRAELDADDFARCSTDIPRR